MFEPSASLWLTLQLRLLSHGGSARLLDLGEVAPRSALSGVVALDFAAVQPLLVVQLAALRGDGLLLEDEAHFAVVCSLLAYGDVLLAARDSGLTGGDVLLLSCDLGLPAEQLLLPVEDPAGGVLQGLEAMSDVSLLSLIVVSC
jgi:hypothetical protein